MSEQDLASLDAVRNSVRSKLVANKGVKFRDGELHRLSLRGSIGYTIYIAAFQPTNDEYGCEGPHYMSSQMLHKRPSRLINYN